MITMLCDAFSALFSIITAAAAFGICEMATPRRKLWFPMPLYVRTSIYIVGADSVFRAAHWCWLAVHPLEKGHANLMTPISWAIIAYYFAVVAYSVFRRRLPPQAWQAIREFGLQEAKRYRPPS